MRKILIFLVVFLLLMSFLAVGGIPVKTIVKNIAPKSTPSPAMVPTTTNTLSGSLPVVGLNSKITALRIDVSQLDLPQRFKKYQSCQEKEGYVDYTFVWYYGNSKWRLPVNGQVISESNYDTCSGDNLNEWYCEGNMPQQRKVGCGYGCKTERIASCAAPPLYSCKLKSSRGIVIDSTESYTESECLNAFSDFSLNTYCWNNPAENYYGIYFNDNQIQRLDCPVYQCTETDQGLDYSVFGEINGYDTNGIYIETEDFCNGNQLIEYYCNGDGRQVNVELKECEYGCSEGACVEEPLHQDCGIITTDVKLERDVFSEGICFTIGAEDITLDCQGHKIRYGNSEHGYGVFNEGFDNVTVKGCEIEELTSTDSGKFSIFFRGVDHGVIENNVISTIRRGSHGIYLVFCSSNLLENNLILAKGRYNSAFRLLGSSQNTFRNNQVTKEDDGEGFRLDNSRDNILQENIITMTGDWGHGFTLFSSNNNQISNNTIVTTKQVSFGVYIEQSEENNVENNNITILGENGAGIHLGKVLFSSVGNTLKNNKITMLGPSGRGIWIEDSLKNNVLLNNIETPKDYAQGLYLEGSNENTLQDNYIHTSSGGKRHDDGVGIALVELSQNNNLINNKVVATHAYEIFSSDDVSENKLIYNNENGQIQWDSSQLNIDIPLVVGETIYLDYNQIGLVPNPNALALNEAIAKIEIYRLPYSLPSDRTPWLLKDGLRCDNTNLCTDLNYGEGVLRATVNGSGLYSTSLPVE